MKQSWNIFILCAILAVFQSCKNQLQNTDKTEAMTAKEILGNANYQAICFGGYRLTTRDSQPSVQELKEDMKILSAMGIRVVRTYHTKRIHAANVVEAIHQLKTEDSTFEMYVMLGIWIDCENAWTANPNHNAEDSAANRAETERAIAIAQKHPDIVKIVAVGNEAMVHWAAAYYVQPKVILRWVNHLQNLKEQGDLPADLWITCSDNFASWGGGDPEYHNEDLRQLIKAVDYVSLHTYPMHDTHYNPAFWGIEKGEEQLSKKEQIELAMERAKDYAVSQYKNSVKYIKSVDPDKQIHIGETGWASASNGFYGDNGSMATDEYKEALYYRKMKEWCKKEGISCFYFEAFNEIWKDAENQGGSENHFGLFTLDGKAKYVLWDKVDQGIFDGLKRGGNAIEKTFNGDFDSLFLTVKKPPFKPELTKIK